MRKRGFTLIEMVVVIALMGILLSALFVLYQRHGILYSYEQVLVEVSGSARSSVAEIVEAGAQAQRVIASRTVNGVSRTSNATTVIFELPSIDAQSQAVSGAFDYIVFYKDDNDFWMDAEMNAQSVRKVTKKKLSSSMSALTFSYDNVNFTLVRKVTVDLEMSKRLKTQTIKANLKQVVTLRNF
jgi:prepilin-type N-terminal cleavage/methylation domain-containing protein